MKKITFSTCLTNITGRVMQFESFNAQIRGGETSLQEKDDKNHIRTLKILKKIIKLKILDFQPSVVNFSLMLEVN